MSDFVKFDHRFTFIWHTSWQEPCPICRWLNGTVFTDQSLYQHVLFHPIVGALWDLDNDVPLVHPNCKCYLEVQYESTLEELLGLEPSGYEEFNIMTSNIKEMKRDIEDFEKSLANAESRIENTRSQLITYMLLLRRMNLPPDVNKFISIMIRARMVSEQAVRAAYLLMAASGPWGWAMAIATAGVATLGTADIIMDLGGQ